VSSPTPTGLAQARGLGVLLLGQPLKLVFHPADLVGEGGDELEQRPERTAEFERHAGGGGGREGRGRARRQPCAPSFHRAAPVSDEAGARAHQRIAGPQLGEIGLGLDPAVADRLEQRRVEPPEPSQGLGIDPITLAVTAIDPPELARIGDQHLVPEALEQATDPGRVGADLEDDPSAGQRGAMTLERRGRGAEPLRGADLPSAIERRAG
jgi:hypothetical protein